MPQNIIMKQKFKNHLLGTFQLNGYMDIHCWYNYLAGYSAQFVEEIIEEENIMSSDVVLDPFCGVGTTNIVCKKYDIHSVGIEVNPFTAFVARTKLFWDFDKEELDNNFINFFEYLNKNKKQKNDFQCDNVLLSRAFSPKILNDLLFIKSCIEEFDFSGRTYELRNLYKLGLISILRKISNYESFSPYLKRRDKQFKDAPVIDIFKSKIREMIKNLHNVENNNVSSKIYNNDARELSFLDKNFDLVVTSPPYLNNWDYSWITKIELFFLGYANSNEDLNKGFRKELIKSSTYLVNGTEAESIIPDSEVKGEILRAAYNLKKKRLDIKNGKKYDIAVLEYFNDIYKILSEIYKRMNYGSKNIWVVGDSGLYGEHIRTDLWTGKISELAGFEFSGLDVLRERRASRHKIKLRESVVYMEK